MTADTSVLKQQAIAAIESKRDLILHLSSTLHANPEVAFQEHKSAALLAGALESNGFKLQRGLGGLETAFRADLAGAAPGPTIALLAEYDALPELGHACGHNIIGSAAIGAALGVQAVLDRLNGNIAVIGTPAEEGGGGKVILVEKGAFSGIDAALMIHPASYTMVGRASLASFRLNIEFAGKASHAAAAPDDGVNALEAVILTFNNINALRLHLKPDARVHGIITHGGTAANIIPDYAAASFSVRAASQTYTLQIMDRVIACAEAAALATGARLTHSVKGGYAAMKPNKVIGQLMAENWRSLGVEVHDPRPNERMGSTDFGNVSQVVPGIHAYIAIAPDGTAGHTHEFRAASISEEGNRGLLNAAKGMAMTVVELLGKRGALERAKKEFAADAA